MSKKKHILKHKTGFKTPENYFEDFQMNMPSFREEIEIENKSIDSGFKVPQNYFENFKVELPQENKKGKVISLFSVKTISKVLAIAAIFLIGFFVFKSQFAINQFSNEVDINPIALEEQLEKDYFDIEFRDFDVSLNGNNTVDEKELKSIDEDAILDYLSENAELITLIEE